MKRCSFLLASIKSELVFRSKPGRLQIRDITRRGHAALSKYTVIADERFNIGEAWYCRDEETGAIHRISPEYGPLVQFVNVSLPTFLASFEAAAEWSTHHDSGAIKGAPGLVDALARSLVKIDTKAFATPEHHWPMLMDHIKTCIADADEDMEFWFKKEVELRTAIRPNAKRPKRASLPRERGE